MCSARSPGRHVPQMRSASMPCRVVIHCGMAGSIPNCQPQGARQRLCGCRGPAGPLLWTAPDRRFRTYRGCSSEARRSICVSSSRILRSLFDGSDGTTGTTASEVGSGGGCGGGVKPVGGEATATGAVIEIASGGGGEAAPVARLAKRVVRVASGASPM
jgi:hypothetical protein